MNQQAGGGDPATSESYEYVAGWPALPGGESLGDVGGVGVDAEDRVYVFSRGPRPVLVFDRDGNLLSTWGEGLFVSAHGVTMGPDESIYLTDSGNHTVRKFTLDGRLLLTIGTPDAPAPYLSGEPFNRCTHAALSPEGDIYITDGYGNARVHKYSADGRHLHSWGASGAEPGEFNIPHNIACDPEGRVYVADRENNRVQVFDGDGAYLEQWNNLHRPCALAIDPHRPDRFFIGEAGPGLAVNVAATGLGQRILVVDGHGGKVGRFGSGRFGTGPEDFVAPHGIAVDSEGSLYVSEVASLAWPDYNGGAPAPGVVRTLRKLRRV